MSKIVLKWLGGRRYIPGVPGRDLTEDDIENLPPGVDVASLLHSGIYGQVEKEEPRRTKKSVKKTEELTDE